MIIGKSRIPTYLRANMLLNEALTISLMKTKKKEPGHGDCISGVCGVCTTGRD